MIRIGLFLALTALAAPLAAAIPQTMQAVVAHEYGAPEVLKIENLPLPRPKENEVLVRVIASGVNPADPLIISGKYAREFGTHLPLIPGYDVAGIVQAVGAKVKRLKQGDSIYAYLLWGGGWAQYCLTNEGEAALKPASLSGVEASSVPLAALTAWQALVDTAKLAKGQTVLVQGGAGGVGSFGVQIAKALGARVIATASTANQEALSQLGADEAIDYTKDPFEQKVHAVDVILDTVGGETLARSYSVVKKGGIVVTIRGPLDRSAAEKFGIRVSGLASHPDAQELAEISKLIDAGKIRPLISRVRPLAEAIEAAKQAETHHTRGKVVLKIADE